MGSRKALARFLRSEPSPAHAHAAFHTIPPATKPRPPNQKMARQAQEKAGAVVGVAGGTGNWAWLMGRGWWKLCVGTRCDSAGDACASCCSRASSRTPLRAHYGLSSHEPHWFSIGPALVQHCLRHRCNPCNVSSERRPARALW